MVGYQFNCDGVAQRVSINQNALRRDVTRLYEVVPGYFRVVLNAGFRGFTGTESFAKPAVINHEDVASELRKALGMMQVLTYVCILPMQLKNHGSCFRQRLPESMNSRFLDRDLDRLVGNGRHAFDGPKRPADPIVLTAPEIQPDSYVAAYQQACEIMQRKLFAWNLFFCLGCLRSH